MAEIQNSEKAVSNLQRYLRRLSFEDGGPERVAIDGIFDDNTRQSLTSFQISAGLDPTGIADKETWDALWDEYLRVTELEREESLSLFPQFPREYSFGYGDRFLLVNVLQLIMMELALIYDAFEDVEESGIYDGDTERAVRTFQRINLLEETGRVDRRTWSRLVREYENVSRNYF